MKKLVTILFLSFASTWMLSGQNLGQLIAMIEMDTSKIESYISGFGWRLLLSAKDSSGSTMMNWERKSLYGNSYEGLVYRFEPSDTSDSKQVFYSTPGVMVYNDAKVNAEGYGFKYESSNHASNRVFWTHFIKGDLLLSIASGKDRSTIILTIGESEKFLSVW